MTTNTLTTRQGAAYIARGAVALGGFIPVTIRAFGGMIETLDETKLGGSLKNDSWFDLGLGQAKLHDSAIITVKEFTKGWLANTTLKKEDSLEDDDLFSKDVKEDKPKTESNTTVLKDNVYIPTKDMGCTPVEVVDGIQLYTFKQLGKTKYIFWYGPTEDDYTRDNNRENAIQSIKDELMYSTKPSTDTENVETKPSKEFIIKKIDAMSKVLTPEQMAQFMVISMTNPNITEEEANLQLGLTEEQIEALSKIVLQK